MEQPATRSLLLSFFVFFPSDFRAKESLLAVYYTMHSVGDFLHLHHVVTTL